MATCYRLSSDHRLPSHWCYCEAWDKERQVIDLGDGTCDVEQRIIDNRAVGCQVWDSLESVLAAIRGEPGVDGDYTEYGLLLVIETDGFADGGYWHAVTEATVTRVRSVAVDELPIDATAEEIHAAIERLAIEEPIEWYDSLPCPY